MYPFRNLAFQGGGTKALAYHGAVRVLEEAGILAQIERVAGTSAGATLATLLSMRLDMDEIQRAYASFDVNDFQESLSGRPPDGAPPPRILGRLQDNISSMSRLATRYGWYSLAYYYEWLQDALSIYCKGYERATFAQFRSWGFRDLYIVVTNLTKRRTELFCADRTPDVAVVDALVMSQSLPLFFEGLQYDGQQFGHGLGHGVGLAVHEKPRASRLSEDVLEAGMSLTVEPGIYLPGEFGVRLEDLVVVRPQGIEILSQSPKSPVLS